MSSFFPTFNETAITWEKKEKEKKKPEPLAFEIFLEKKKTELLKIFF